MHQEMLHDGGQAKAGLYFILGETEVGTRHQIIIRIGADIDIFK
jgi:hypothetical protein